MRARLMSLSFPQSWWINSALFTPRETNKLKSLPSTTLSFASMKNIKLLAALCATTLPLFAAEEKPVTFVPAKPDPLVGDWQGKNSPYVAQVYFAEDGNYQANLLKQFDTENNVVAVLKSARSGDNISFTGDGWSVTLANQ